MCWPLKSLTFCLSLFTKVGNRILAKSPRKANKSISPFLQPADHKFKSHKNSKLTITLILFWLMPVIDLLGEFKTIATWSKGLKAKCAMIFGKASAGNLLNCVLMHMAAKISNLNAGQIIFAATFWRASAQRPNNNASFTIKGPKAPILVYRVAVLHQTNNERDSRSLARLWKIRRGRSWVTKRDKIIEGNREKRKEDNRKKKTKNSKDRITKITKSKNSKSPNFPSKISKRK